jgi:hypothetical protein
MGACQEDDKHWLRAKTCLPSPTYGVEAEEFIQTVWASYSSQSSFNARIMPAIVLPKPLVANYIFKLFIFQIHPSLPYQIVSIS